ncbi:MAG: AAA family ATPase, partial [Verrucomicrobiota bacterium]
MSATLPDPEQIEGTVHAIVYHNEENGYTIMQVASKDRGTVTVLGHLPAVVEGEEVKAYGNWRKDKRFGSQFEADRIQAITPATGKGIERFLASGLIEGIGNAYAKRIVEKFGTETLRIIDEESQRLEEVQGIGKARRQTIKASWKRQQSVRDIMVFLHEHGLSTARALRLHKSYGAEAVNVLRADPYRLARELTGIGFKTADEIARKLGQAEDSPKRIEAGLNYTLEQAEHQGHSALPREDLISQASETLGAERELVEAALSRLLQLGHLVREILEAHPEDENLDLIFSDRLHEAESLVSKKVKTFLAADPSLPTIQPDAAIAWFERHHELNLGEEQAAAVVEATRHRISILTGGPGVGKTTIINAVLEILAAKGVKPLLCAPTGRAARQLAESTGREAATIHRTLEYQPDGGFQKGASDPLDADFFVIDEASMIDTQLMANLLAAIPPHGSILLVGDVDQLPSVGSGCVLRDLIESGAVPVSRLTRIYRQAESSRIVSAAHEVNAGKLPPLDNDPKS